MAYGDEQDDSPEPEPETGARLSKKQQAKICEKALACWNAADAADGPQLAREKEDIGFYAGGDFQWDQSAIDARAGRPAADGMPAIPGRPRLTINKLRQPVRQLQNQERNAHLGAELIPADDFPGGVPQAVKDEVELREGLYRRIQRESEAQAAHSWAFDRVAQAGRGFWRVLIEPVSDRSFDNKIVIKRIYNQSSVRLDPSHVEPDGSDARWGLIAVDMSEEAYKAEFPSSKLSHKDPTSADEFTGLMSQSPAWFTSDTKGNRSIRVAEYFWTEYEQKTLCWTPQGVFWKEQLPEGVPAIGPPNAAGQPTKPKTVSVPTIKWAKINGAQEVLDYEEWAGRYIPIIKEVGEELQPFDEDRRCEGIVRPGIPGQQGFNFMVSAMVETIALAPKAPYIATPEQLEGYTDWYTNAAVLPLPYLLYNPVSENGKPLDRPTRDVQEPAIQAIAFGISTFSQSVHDTTGIPEASLGSVDPQIKSGRAILALQKQAQQATSNYLDNHARSIRHEARIVDDLIFPVYGNRPDRMVTIMNPQGEQEARIIGPGPSQQGQKRVQLSDRQFNPVIKVGKSYDTRSEEGAAMLAETLAPNPEMMAAYMDLFFKLQTWPGADIAAERAKLMLPPQVQQHEAMKNQDPKALLMQMQAQMAQQGKMVEALTQRVKEQQMAIETDTIKQAGETERERMKIESEERIAAMKTQADLAKTQATIDAQRAQLTIKGQMDRILAGLEDQHELLQGEVSHRQAMQQGQMAHEQGLEAGEVGHQQGLEASVLDNSMQTAETEPTS